MMADSESDVEPEKPCMPSSGSHLATKGLEQPAAIPAVKGRIHSIDTFSAVDGPGLRMVVFEQVRCLCMHAEMPITICSSQHAVLVFIHLATAVEVGLPWVAAGHTSACCPVFAGVCHALRVLLQP
jgi:hypothetical protein